MDLDGLMEIKATDGCRQPPKTMVIVVNGHSSSITGDSDLSVSVYDSRWRWLSSCQPLTIRNRARLHHVPLITSLERLEHQQNKSGNGTIIGLPYNKQCGEWKHVVFDVDWNDLVIVRNDYVR